MCEFCIQHGEGKKWYLEAGNYSEDLLSDIRRRKFIDEFFREEEKFHTFRQKLEELDEKPWFVKRFARWRLNRFFRKKHHGQVVPLEDIERIFAFTNSIVRVNCICRHIATGKEERYCYGVSMGENGGEIAKIISGTNTQLFGKPDSRGLEELSPADALSQLKDHERQGLCHTIWTFITPYIAGICNCDRPDCLAMKATVTHGQPALYRAEYVAGVDSERCTGCRRCMHVCQFGALSYSAASRKVYPDVRRCFGCGICRSVCEAGAISLNDRSGIPAVANLW